MGEGPGVLDLPQVTSQDKEAPHQEPHRGTHERQPSWSLDPAAVNFFPSPSRSTLAQGVPGSPSIPNSLRTHSVIPSQTVPTPRNILERMESEWNLAAVSLALLFSVLLWA